MSEASGYADISGVSDDDGSVQFDNDRLFYEVSSPDLSRSFSRPRSSRARSRERFSLSQCSPPVGYIAVSEGSYEDLNGMAGTVVPMASTIGVGLGHFGIPVGHSQFVARRSSSLPVVFDPPHETYSDRKTDPSNVPTTAVQDIEDHENQQLHANISQAESVNTAIDTVTHNSPMGLSQPTAQSSKFVDEREKPTDQPQIQKGSPGTENVPQKEATSHEGKNLRKSQSHGRTGVPSRQDAQRSIASQSPDIYPGIYGSPVSHLTPVQDWPNVFAQSLGNYMLHLDICDLSIKQDNSNFLFTRTSIPISDGPIDHLTITKLSDIIKKTYNVNNKQIHIFEKDAFSDVLKSVTNGDTVVNTFILKDRYKIVLSQKAFSQTEYPVIVNISEELHYPDHPQYPLLAMNVTKVSHMCVILDRKDYLEDLKKNIPQVDWNCSELCYNGCKLGGNMITLEDSDIPKWAILYLVHKKQMNLTIQYHERESILIQFILAVYTTDTVKDVKVKFIEKFGDFFQTSMHINLNSDMSKIYLHTTRALLHDTLLVSFIEQSRLQDNLHVLPLYLELGQEDSFPLQIHQSRGKGDRFPVSTVLMVTEENTVGTLKTKISTRVGLPVEAQKIIYCKEKLVDSNTLASYGIKRDPTKSNCFHKVNVEEASTHQITVHVIKQEKLHATHKLKVYKSMTVKALQVIVSKKSKNNDVENLVLIHEDTNEILPLHKTLRECHVKNGTSLVARIYLHWYKIRVKTPGQPIITFVINDSERFTVGDLKEDLSEKIQIDPARQNIVHAGKCLDDLSLLHQTTIKGGDMIWVTEVSHKSSSILSKDSCVLAVDGKGGQQVAVFMMDGQPFFASPKLNVNEQFSDENKLHCSKEKKTTAHKPKTVSSSSQSSTRHSKTHFVETPPSLDHNCVPRMTQLENSSPNHSLMSGLAPPDEKTTNSLSHSASDVRSLEIQSESFQTPTSSGPNNQVKFFLDENHQSVIPHLQNVTTSSSQHHSESKPMPTSLSMPSLPFQSNTDLPAPTEDELSQDPMQLSLHEKHHSVDQAVMPFTSHNRERQLSSNSNEHKLLHESMCTSTTSLKVYEDKAGKKMKRMIQQTDVIEPLEPQNLHESGIQLPFNTNPQLGTRTIVSQVGTYPEQLACQEPFATARLEKCVSKNVILQIYTKIGRQWKHVGRYLGLQEEELEAIENKHKTDLHECSFNMLHCWLNKYGAAATKELLIYALRSNGFQNLVDEYVMPSSTSEAET